MACKYKNNYARNAGLTAGLLTMAVAATTVAQEDPFESGIPEYRTPEENVLRGKAFLFSANIGAEFGAESNVFREHDETDSDTVMSIYPEFAIRTNSETGFDGIVRLDIEHDAYSDFSFNDQTSVALSGQGSWELSDERLLSGRFQAGQKEIGIGGFSDDEDDGASAPTKYNYLDAEGAYAFEGERFYGRGGAAYENLDYDNVARLNPTPSGSTEIINDDRDRDGWTIGGTAGRVMADGSKLGLAADWQTFAYDQQIDSTADISRDSDAIRAMVEYEMAPASPRYQMKAAAGIENRKFDAEEYEDFSTLVFKVDGSAAVSPSTDLLLRLEREVEETTLLDTSSAVSTGVRAEVRSVLSPKVRVRGLANYSNLDFRVNEELNGRDDREDDRLFVYGEAAYEVRGNIWVYGGGSLIDRTSTRDRSEYDGNKLFVGVRTEY